ncbi:MAG: patatin-like phospholipase family protein [Deltaproteobacteria bacterium]|nr:patatin-like phospholipase family protein [Deltaproteobacteria bacterium]
MQGASEAERPTRVAIVLSGGGARGAYEAGVLSYLFEHIYPQLRPEFEFDIVSGTSVGAIHAGYIAASADQTHRARARDLVEIWSSMALDDVLQLSARDLFGVPLRALGIEALVRGRREGAAPELVGGLVDISPLERLVEERIPWSGLRGNIAAGRPRAVCVSCTDIDTGLVTVFIDGEPMDTSAWDGDRYAQAIRAEITSRHVRASAAIPFLFPAVRIGDRYYLDGGLRVNTPLSPALRLGADKVLVIGLKCAPSAEKVAPHAERAITQPAFLLGKMLNVLILDQIEHELRRVDTINTLLEAASDALGSGCISMINDAIRGKRGLEYRKVDTVVVRPSRDLGAIAADAYRRRSRESRSRGVMARMLARLSLHGVPDEEADLFSYLYFDASYTRPLVDLGRADARDQEEEILRLLS